MSPKTKRININKHENGKLPKPVKQLGPHRYLNRELSWLEFNRRILGEALSSRHPLLERIKFLSIFSSNLDEFFMVRVAGLREQIDAGVQERSPDGLTPNEQFAILRPQVISLTERQRICWFDDLLPQLRASDILICNYDELTPAQQDHAHAFFQEQIFPVLTPLAFDPGHPFPHISNLSLNLAVVVHDPRSGERFARLKIPEVLPRLIELPVDQGRRVFVWLEQVVAANLGVLFPGMQVTESYPFRVTRDADVELQEEEASDLLSTIQSTLRRRHFGRVVRLAVESTIPTRILEILVENMEIATDDVYMMPGPLGFHGLMQLAGIDRPNLKDSSFTPQLPASLETADNVFEAVAAKDMLLHHPYDSFMTVVDFLNTAADDPNVLAIKQTLYRVGHYTPQVDALMRAREHGKQVTVLVELKARFDEENNIEWALALEEAGVHVVYGLVGLKTHCKIALVVRKEGKTLRRYVHLSTGNYNATTAALYTDIGLLTSRDDLGADASDLFNFLTGYSDQRAYRRFLVAPIDLRDAMLRLIKREIEFHSADKPGRLIFKMNTLTDPTIIEALYGASQAGVEIDLIVRGVCCLRPGVPGLSQTIRVRSIIGRFLEHSRIFFFGNGGNNEVYLGSADMMSRNLDRRVEVVFPVEDPNLVAHLRDKVLAIYLEDTLNAHLLQSDGTYHRTDGTPCDVQAWFLTHAH
ncbi:MAG: polyphosphate kinase 1 [Herpetosiphonaceae bacterium]|nr:polyphosphate kinase 1 [Herpetosiphonaceae bacterium]